MPCLLAQKERLLASPKLVADGQRGAPLPLILRRGNPRIRRRKRTKERRSERGNEGTSIISRPPRMIDFSRDGRRKFLLVNRGPSSDSDNLPLQRLTSGITHPALPAQPDSRLSAWNLPWIWSPFYRSSRADAGPTTICVSYPES